MDLQIFEKTGKKIVVCGTTFVDIKGYPDVPFIPAGRNTGQIAVQFGGVGRNVSADLAGLGIPNYFVSQADPEGYGAAIVEDLNQAGVNTAYVLRHENGIGTWLAIMNPEGDVYANVSKRQDLSPLSRMLEKEGDAIFCDTAGILVEMDMDEAVISAIFRFAEKYNTDVYGVISNITVAMERLAYIKKTKCFVCNRQEALMLFSEHAKSPETVTPAEMLRLTKEHIRRSGITGMIVTMDKDGAVYADIAGSEGFAPAEKVQIVDSTGAGDSFFAGAAVSLIYGYDLRTACEVGTAMASRVIASVENVYCGRS